MSEEKKRLGLTQAEFDNLMQAVRYGVIIVIAVLLTFTILATVTRYIGYESPATSSYEATSEISNPID